MPRRTQSTSTPKKLKQKKLDAFLSSSPAPSPRRSPSSPRKRPKRKRRAVLHKDSGDDAPGPSHLPVGDDDSQSSDPGAIHFEPRVVVVSDTEDEPPPPISPKVTRKGKKRARAVSEDIESDDEGVRARKGKRVVKKPASVVLDSDEEELPPRKRGKLVKGKRPPTPDEDEDDLMGEVDQKSAILTVNCWVRIPTHSGFRDHRAPPADTRQAVRISEELGAIEA